MEDDEVTRWSLVTEIRDISGKRGRKEYSQLCRWHWPMSPETLVSEDGQITENLFLDLCFQAFYESLNASPRETIIDDKSELSEIDRAPEVNRDLSGLLDFFFEQPILLEFIYGPETEATTNYRKTVATALMDALLAHAARQKQPLKRDAIEAIIEATWEALRSSALHGFGTLQMDAYFIWRLVHHGWGRDITLRQLLRFYRHCRGLGKQISQATLGRAPDCVTSNESTLEHLGDEVRALMSIAMDMRSKLMQHQLLESQDRRMMAMENILPNARELRSAIACLSWNASSLVQLPHALMRWIYGTELVWASLRMYRQPTTFWWQRVANPVLVHHCVLDALLEVEVEEIRRELDDERLSSDLSMMHGADTRTMERSELLLFNPQAYLETEWKRVEASLMQTSNSTIRASSLHSAEHGLGNRRSESSSRIDRDADVDDLSSFSSGVVISQTPTSVSSLNASSSLNRKSPHDRDELQTLGATAGHRMSVTDDGLHLKHENEMTTTSQTRFEPSALDQNSLCRILCVHGRFYICGGGIPCSPLSKDAL